MAGNRREYTVKANSSISEGLQFVAQSVIVDNPNSYYIYLSYLRRFVPPFTTGAVLHYGITPSIAAFETDLRPPGVAPLNNIQDSGARVIFSEDEIPESGGSASSTNVQSGNFLGHFTQTNQGYWVQIPIGTTTIGLTVASGIGSVLQIFGAVTGQFYFTRSWTTANNQEQYFVPVQPADSELQIYLSNPLNVYVYAYGPPQAVVVSQNPGSVLYTHESPVGNKAILCAPFGAGIGVGGSFTILPSGVGLNYILHHLSATPVTASNTDLRLEAGSGNGTPFAAVRCEALAPGSYPLMGQVVQPSYDVVLRSNAGAACTIGGYLLYSLV